MTFGEGDYDQRKVVLLRKVSVDRMVVVMQGVKDNECSLVPLIHRNKYGVVWRIHWNSVYALYDAKYVHHHILIRRPSM